MADQISARALVDAGTCRSLNTLRSFPRRRHRRKLSSQVATFAREAYSVRLSTTWSRDGFNVRATPKTNRCAA